MRLFLLSLFTRLERHKSRSENLIAFPREGKFEEMRIPKLLTNWREWKEKVSRRSVARCFLSGIGKKRGGGIVFFLSFLASAAVVKSPFCVGKVAVHRRISRTMWAQGYARIAYPLFPRRVDIRGNKTGRFAWKIVDDNRFITRMRQSRFYTLIA